MELPSLVALILFSWFLLADNVHHVSAERSVYIVHMDKSYMPKAFSSHHHWYSSMLNSVKSVDRSTDKPEPELIYTYDNAFHGFSALMSKEEVGALKRSEGFISAYPDAVVTPDTTHSTEFLSLNAAAGLWPASEYGEDVIIGVIDSGIWPESPSFRDDGMTEIPARWNGICQEGEGFKLSMCNRKLIGARYFNRGAQAANPGGAIRMNSARDVDGHGSHVASIAAGNYVDDVSFFGYANGTARGVAPRARLAVYKVLWNLGGGDDRGSDIIAGIDQAVADGVDILSISIGPGPDHINLYDNPLSIASFGAREKGVLVCFSGGNRGPGIRTVRSGIPWAVVVAAGTIDRWFAGTLTLGNGKTITGWTMFPARATVRNLPLVYNETLSVCDSILTEAPFQSIVVCNLSMENADFSSVMSYLPNSEARAAIIINSEDLEIYRSTSFSSPGVVISPAEGREVIKYALSSASPTATIDFQQTILGTQPRAAPALADFSSRGPARSYEGILKPDVMAPGVLILAAYYPHALGPRIGNNVFLSSDYTLLWGTSMACPHISGVAALLKAAHPEWSPAAVQSAMMTTANPLDSTKQPIKEVDYDVTTPLGIGSGFVDPNRALDPGLIYDNSPQDFVNLVCSMNFTREQTRTIIRSNYNCSNPSSDLNYPSFVATFHPPQEGKTLTRTFQRIVTNVGNGTAKYHVKVEEPRKTQIKIKPKTLVFRKKYEKQKYTLTIRFVADIDTQHRDGSITWIEETGRHTVRSPIMVSAGADFFS